MAAEMEEKETFVLEEHYISDDDDNVNYDIISDGGEDDDDDGNVGLVTLADIERSIQRKEEARAGAAQRHRGQRVLGVLLDAQRRQPPFGGHGRERI